MQSAISINNLTVAYKNIPALWNINAVIPQGVLCAVAGPNGAGKSTLLKTIVQLIKPVAGTITLGNTTHPQQHTHIAYVPQRMQVDWDFPITPFEVTLMGCYGRLGWFKKPTDNDIMESYRMLAMVDLSAFAHAPINTLSCGQQQRVFLARALMQNASLLLLDEPLTGIDAFSERNILTLLQQLRDQGKTIVVIHHDLKIIEQYFDWILLLNVHLIAQGAPTDIITNATINRAYVKDSLFSPLS